MRSQYDILQENEQEAQKTAQELAQQLEIYLLPFLQTLDTFLDKRLVRTLLHVCIAILRYRHNKQGLLLSELGSYVNCDPTLSASAAAGTKRISKLLLSVKWSILNIDRYLLKEADKKVKDLKEQGKRIFCIWDGSVLEKPESSALEGLCPVVSSKAKRLSRSKKGLVFNLPPAKPVTVAGMNWTGALIAGMEGQVKVAAMSWWTTKGEYATNQRAQEEEMIRKIVRQWGNILVHIFDRGYCSGPWLKFFEALGIKFVIRWKKGHNFFDANGKKMKLWQIGRGKKYLAHKQIYDTHTGEKMPCDIWWAPVRHESYGQQLYVVKARVKKHVWYLVTNEPVKTAKQAWEILFAYRRRWQIETSFRYEKSELALESPRLELFENRLKLLGIVTLVYSFLLSLLDPGGEELVQRILRLRCHRTGKRCREAVKPLYRLRWAISRLWNDYHPALGSLFRPHLKTIRVLALLRC